MSKLSMSEFLHKQDKCVSCEMPYEGMLVISKPEWMVGKFICDACLDDVRVCEDCGSITDSGDTYGEVSFCEDCRSVESMKYIEAEGGE